MTTLFDLRIKLRPVRLGPRILLLGLKGWGRRGLIYSHRRLASMELCYMRPYSGAAGAARGVRRLPPVEGVSEGGGEGPPMGGGAPGHPLPAPGGGRRAGVPARRTLPEGFPEAARQSANIRLVGARTARARRREQAKDKGLEGGYATLPERLIRGRVQAVVRLGRGL